MAWSRSLLCAAVLACVVSAAPAQQFDSFGAGPLDGFDLNAEGADDTGIPSLGEDGALFPVGPEIQLNITDGQSGVGLSTFPGTGSPVTSVIQPAATRAGRVTLRALDKMLGRPTDIDLAVGETVIFGRLAIRAIECRYPVEDPSSDAYAHLEILDSDGNALFDGWMIASSPALSALEHPRYDVWVLRCSDA